VTNPPRRLTALGLAGGIALIPLSGQVVALDPTRPPIPLLGPPAVGAAILFLTLAALAAIVPAAVRAARRDALTVVCLAPGLGVMLSGAAGFDPPTGIGLGVVVTGLGASGLALAREADAATVRLVTRAFLWSALVASAFALLMVAARVPAAIYAYDNGRAVGTFLNPNELAAYTLIALGVALPLAVGSRGRDRLAVASAALLLIALAATFSRWGAFSAVCGVAVYALLARRRGLLAVALAIALVGLGLNALVGNLHHNPRDTQTRLAAWRAGLATFERFPLLGVGPLAYGRVYPALRPPAAPGPQAPVAFDPHSMLLSFAAEAGLVAVGTLLAWLAVVLRRVIREAGRAAGTPRLVGFGLAAGLVALLVDGALNTVSLSFALVLQVAPLALAVLRTDAP
jgi:O-antigen ligase